MKMRGPVTSVICCFAGIVKHLECCDLRKIQNRRDGNDVRRDVNRRVMIDAEVAHRMGRKQPRQDDQVQEERDAQCCFHSTGTTFGACKPDGKNAGAQMVCVCATPCRLRRLSPSRRGRIKTLTLPLLISPSWSLSK